MHPRCRMGTGHTSLQRFHEFARSRNTAPMGLPWIGQPLVCGKRPDVFAPAVEVSSETYHPCLGLGRRSPYSVPESKFPMSWQAAELIKQRISLLDYLQGQGWKPAHQSAGA